LIFFDIHDKKKDVKKQNIVFIGFRGAGKKTFGRELAKQKNLPFTDIETEIEFIIGESIPNFVEKHGWQVFREIEQRVTHDFSRNFSGILASGGATIENSKNLQNLKKTGLFVFLNTDFSEVVEILIKNKEEKKRPRVNPNISLEDELKQMWEQRKNIYAAIAEIEVKPSLKNPKNEETQKIVASFEKLLPQSPSEKKVAIINLENNYIVNGLLEIQKRGRIPNITFSLIIGKEKTYSLKSNIKYESIDYNSNSQTERTKNLIHILREENPDIILLLGDKEEIGSAYFDQFGGSTIYAIPSITETKSENFNKEAHLKKVLEYEEKYTGCTFLRCTSKDAGDSILQRKILIDAEDTTDILSMKIQKQKILGFAEILEKRDK